MSTAVLSEHFSVAVFFSMIWLLEHLKQAFDNDYGMKFCDEVCGLLQHGMWPVTLSTEPRSIATALQPPKSVCKACVDTHSRAATAT